MSTIVVLTRAYPFPPGEQFIFPEAPHWAGDGRRVVVMPWKIDGGEPVELPDGVELDLGLAGAVKAAGLGNLLRGVLRAHTVRELGRMVGGGKVSRAGLVQIATAARGAEVTRRHLRSWIDRHGPVDVVYSYWFDVWTIGALTLKGEGVNSVVTRVHNYDLYQNRHPAGFHALKRQYGPRLDAVLPISRSGGEEAVRAFSTPPSRVHLARLGTVIPGTLGGASTDGVCRIVSCSFLQPVKRVDRIVLALQRLATQYPGDRFEWTHLGGGPLLDELRAQAAGGPVNLTVNWAGLVSPEQVRQYYRTRPVDVFVNSSDYEGIPVSIMEAMSFGIPVVATDVGATAELVPAEGPGGRLVIAEDDPAKLVAAIDSLINAPDRALERERARTLVEESFDADVNAEALMALLDQLAIR